MGIAPVWLGSTYISYKRAWQINIRLVFFEQALIHYFLVLIIFYNNAIIGSIMIIMSLRYNLFSS